MRHRIAVVEDNPDNRLLIRALLEDRYEIVEYASGDEALVGLVESPADLVLMDISLPGKEGPEVLVDLRADPRTRDLPVIALTAHAMTGDRERYLAAGFDAYLSKPIVEEKDLVDTIEAQLNGRS